MNFTTVNNTLISCGLAFLPTNPTNISPDLLAVFIVRIVVNALTCPLVILLNILVMVAVKSKRQLRTKSNIALACLATSDLVVGLLVQPLQIINSSFLLSGQENMFCNLNKVAVTVTSKCLRASFTHLILISAERYIAIKHPFVYETQVTEVRVIIAFGLAWVIAILLPIQDVFRLTKTDILVYIVVPVLLYFPAMIYFNCVVHKEVRRNERQIAANQVSLEAKEKLLKNKKSFYTTIIVLFAIFLCYIPMRLCGAIVIYFKHKIPINVSQTAFYLVSLLPVLNSLFNPLIYAVRMRYFRVVFIQLLSRKTISQAEELERKIFGPRQIGVTVNAEEGQKSFSQGDVQQGNETLNNGQPTAIEI